MLVWVVKKDKRKMTCEFFSEAWSDFKSHVGELRFIYPKVMSRSQFESLSEFNGW